MRASIVILLAIVLAALTVRVPAADAPRVRVPAAGSDAVLDRVSALERGGTPNLALEVLNLNEPPAEDVRRWMAFEHRRLEILRALRQWDAVATRADNLPESLPADFRRAVLFEAAEARLAQANYEDARRYLRRILWQLEARREDFARAQRTVIRSYLAEKDLADARIALVRYREEYGRGAAWQSLHAEVLLRDGEERAAFELLSGVQTHEARLLRQLAALRAGIYRPRDVLAEAERLAAELRARPALQRQAWVLAAEAAGRAKDDNARVRALERSLTATAAVRREGASPEDPLFRADADDLWAAYERLAETLGNRERLIVGADEDWLKLARRYCRSEPHVARALHAFQTSHAAGDGEREAAHRRLAVSHFAGGGSDIVLELYTQSRRYPTISEVPLPVRYRLADKALADYQIHLAAELVRGLNEPPPGDEDPDGWQLRRARILIYAGSEREAALLLGRLLEGRGQIEPGFADRFLQVLFDLQSVGSHREAVALLAMLDGGVADERLRRELFFWRADSQAALGEHRAAAEFYLRSAMHNGKTGTDPWGHTARYRAAEELARGGLARDARDVYSRLLAETSDPARRTVIERQLQQLWIAERKTTTQ